MDLRKDADSQLHAQKVKRRIDVKLKMMHDTCDEKDTHPSLTKGPAMGNAIAFLDGAASDISGV